METPLDLVARTPEDLLACVPLMLGFVPDESVVMLGLGGPAAPHARIDLGAPDDLPGVCAALLGPALQHGLDRVVLYLFTELDRAREAAGALRGSFAQAGVEVLLLLGCDGRAWVDLDRPDVGPATEFDVLSHPFVTEAVVQGRVVLPSRAALARSLEPVPERVARTGRVFPQVTTPDARWVRATLYELVDGGALPEAVQVARLALAAGCAELSGEIWGTVPRADARRHADLWIAVLRATPAAWAAGPAAVLGMLAWRSGDGALAWCAVDVARGAPAPCPLAEVVAILLESAVSPDELPPTRADHQAGGVA